MDTLFRGSLVLNSVDMTPLKPSGRFSGSSYCAEYSFNEIYGESEVKVPSLSAAAKDVNRVRMHIIEKSRLNVVTKFLFYRSITTFIILI